MSELGGWLERLGLAVYAELFEKEQLTLDLLPLLSHDELKGLGVPLGHRLTILRAAGALPHAATSQVAPPVAKPMPRNEDRRQLTIMFCDLTDSIIISRQLGPEAFRSFLITYRELCARSLRRYGGFTARYVGDSILMYFGYPDAHEDDAERAIRCAFDILAGTAALDAQMRAGGGPQLAVHIGIATGPVVAGDMAAADAAEVAAVTGEAPNLAARLQSLAEAGEVLIDQATRDLAGDNFDYHNLGRRHLKGFEQPVTIWRLVGELHSTRFEAHRRSEAPLIGRETELAALLEQWTLAAAGHGQAAVLAGRSGIGKSRLADAIRHEATEAARRTNAAAPLAIRLQCLPFHSNTPLFPFARTLERMAELQNSDDATTRLAKLKVLLHRSRYDGGDDALPLLAALLSIAGAPTIRTAAMGARERRIRLLQVLGDWLAAVAQVQPVILAFEDVQWIDPTSRMLLGRLLASARQHPMLILVTLRTDDVHDDATAVPETADWLAVPGVAEHGLCELDTSGSRQLIAAIATGRSLPEPIVADIVTKAAGVPFYIEELTRWRLDAARDVAAVIGPDTTADTATVGEVRIPESLSGALMARVDRLGPHKELALKAAVIGAEFTADLLARVAEVSPASGHAGLAVLVDAGILRPVIGTAEPTYRFRHALIRDTAYGSLMTARRCDLHRQVALAMEEMRVSRPETSADLIAQHYARNHSPGRAIQLWQKAAEQAVAKSAHDEAAGLLDKALALVPTLPETPERHALELELTAASAASLRSVRGYAAPVVEQRYMRARELCERVGDSRIRFYVDWGLFQCHLVKGELDRADEFAERLMLNTGGLPDTLRADAYLATGMARLQQGEFESARQFLEQAVALGAPSCDTINSMTHGQSSAIFSRSNLAHTLAFLGRKEEAQSLVDQNLTYFKEGEVDSTQQYAYVNALAFASRVYLLFRDAAAVNHTSMKLLCVARRCHYAYYEAIAITQIGWALAESEDLERGIQEMQRGVSLLDKTGTELGARGFHLELAWLYARCNDTQGARRHFELATSNLHSGTQVWNAEILRLQARIEQMEPDADPHSPAHCLEASIRIAREQGAKLFEEKAIADKLILARIS